MKKILLIAILLAILFLSGCADNRIRVKPNIKLAKNRWKIVAIFVKQRCKTKMAISEIADYLEAEEAYQEYLLSTGLEK